MAIQEIEDQLRRSFESLGKLEENNRFLFSCISEGMIPSGLKLNFNLAKYVNDETFVRNIENIIDNANSRLLDLVYERNMYEENSIYDKLEKLKDDAINVAGDEEGISIFNRTKNTNRRVIQNENRKFTSKLRRLRNKHHGNAHVFRRNGGSRKIFATKYTRKDNNGELPGAPFPKYLRESRRNRPHHRINNCQEYIVTPEDLEERNPIILSSQDVELSEDAKALMRKSPKFCPTPEGPIDEKGQYQAFLRYRESMRWKWFFNKDQDPNNIDNDYSAKPWDTRTEKSAPIATDAPELEAFLAAIERDIKNPTLRRKVKSNLNQNQRKFIKEVRAEYPARGLRVRREDKGPRFVIEDGDVEDNKIMAELSDNTYYTEVDENPIEEFSDDIRFWAAEALENNEITEKQFKFVTSIEDTHLARPKPLYKTHKKNENGEMLNPVPIRTIAVGCGTPVHPLSKLCQLAIEHLTSKEELPRNCKSTKDVLKVVNEINETKTPLPDDTVLALADVDKMYPNVDIEEGLSSVKRRLEVNPSPLGISPDTIVSGLRICLRCNCVQFKDKFYLPNRGVAMGNCVSCDFSDIWMGDVTEKHLNTITIQTLHFILYRDDALDLLPNGDQMKRILTDHLNNLHENLTWTVEYAKEGGYLDLWLMLENGRIEWKNYKKAPAVYVGPDSCHDPMVRSSIVKGVGLRLRINSSKDEYFEESVEDAAKAFKVSGYKYQKTKQELLAFKELDPVELIKKEKVIRKKPEKGVQAYYITNYEPRMLHPRKLISRNYHHINSNPRLAALFPRENLVGGTKRLKNLQELLSPTVQRGHGEGDDNNNNDDDDDNGDPGGGRYNGSYHCKSYKQKQKCDVCSYMLETSYVTSYHFRRNHAIHGRNIHLPYGQRNKMRWFIYLVHDTSCHLLYVGSTNDVCRRWSNTKSACLGRKMENTGLYKHFMQGCPKHLETGNVKHLTWTLVDHIDTSPEQLEDAGHSGGVGCRCSECQRLKDTEDKWICRLGTFNPPNGLNTRDEIKTRSRVNFRVNTGT